MSVFTPLSSDQLQALLAPLGFQLRSVAPAHHGIENTNYLLQARDSAGQTCGLVLTVLEEIPVARLPWFTALLSALARAGLPVPAPVAAPLSVANKPALLVPMLPGRHIQQPQASHCQQVGQALAHLHAAAPSPGSDAQEATGIERLGESLALLPTGWQPAASDVLAQWQARQLPETLIHGDLFRDNVLFEGGRLSGLLDFYAAGRGPALYDLAVAMNDWCMVDDQPEPILETALLGAYEEQMPLPAVQRDLLPLTLCVAALRFWLSRLVAEQRHLDEDLPDTVGRKDPAEFQRRFQARLGGL